MFWVWSSQATGECSGGSMGGRWGRSPPPRGRGGKFFYESRKIFCALTRAELINHAYIKRTLILSRRNNSAWVSHDNLWVTHERRLHQMQCVCVCVRACCQFIMSLFSLSDVLSVTAPLSRMFQTVNFDIYTAKTKITDVVAVLDKTQVGFWTLWWNSVCISMQNHETRWCPGGNAAS